MPKTKYKIRFSFIVEKIPAFASGPSMVREVKKTVTKFQTNCVAIFYLIEYFHLDSLIHFVATRSKSKKNILK